MWLLRDTQGTLGYMHVPPKILTIEIIQSHSNLHCCVTKVQLAILKVYHVFLPECAAHPKKSQLTACSIDNVFEVDDHDTKSVLSLNEYSVKVVMSLF